ncbi:hypothetical protein [Sphingomonas sp. PAMC 26605]|uniref:hypothetical protein n=1 Tax=Sphingomonas sp. PAMC 26605 TaxID=1112214 RepID=UPI0012F4D3CD|nr:hypothetical protein [Sphingomonas sp. PAMC 26605]
MAPGTFRANRIIAQPFSRALVGDGVAKLWGWTSVRNQNNRCIRRVERPVPAPSAEKGKAA